MTGLTSKVSTLLTGSVVPTSPDVMGPMQPQGGLIPGTWHAAGSKPNLMEVISNGLNLGSAAFSLFAANEEAKFAIARSRQEARALELTAQEDMLQAQQEEIRGKQEANNIMDGLIQAIATSRLAAAANGVDPSFGTPVSIEASQKKIANLQMGVTREDAAIRSLSRRRQAYARRIEAGNVLVAGSKEASAARLTGLAKAGGTLAELAQRRSERG